MLDKINNSTSDIDNINQSQTLDRIKNFGATNPFEDDKKTFFIDESNISQEAFAKYQREEDIRHFSEILLNYDEKEANNLVLQQAFGGELSIDDEDFMSELLSNEDFLAKIFE